MISDKQNIPNAEWWLSPHCTDKDQYNNISDIIINQAIYI